MEKAESHHLTASSTWISNQQTDSRNRLASVLPIKKPNLNQTTTKKYEELKKISVSSSEKFCFLPEDTSCYDLY